MNRKHWQPWVAFKGNVKKMSLVAGVPEVDKPNLSLQCFESRHAYCTGRDVFFGHTCECECHSAPQQEGEPQQ